MDSGPDQVTENLTKPSTFSTMRRRIGQKYQKLLDDSVPFYSGRWGFTLLLAFVYIVRVYIIQGWYIVTYALGIYLLNLFIGFLSPKIDPAMIDESDFYDDDFSEEGPALPVKADEEFRPFIRKLPEFKFWHSASKAVLIALICTFFEVFNVPVFWPILVMYFIILFFITMKRQIKHMIKYKYLPFSRGKRKYAGKEDNKVTAH